MTIDVKALAAKTAGEIRKRGWIQGGLFSSEDVDNCSVCLIGAMLFATDCVRVSARGVLWAKWTPTSDAMEEALNERLGISATNWNDTQGRTVDEVLELLDGLAAA